MSDEICCEIGAEQSKTSVQDIHEMNTTKVFDKLSYVNEIQTARL